MCWCAIKKLLTYSLLPPPSRPNVPWMCCSHYLQFLPFSFNVVLHFEMHYSSYYVEFCSHQPNCLLCCWLIVFLFLTIVWTKIFPNLCLYRKILSQVYLICSFILNLQATQKAIEVHFGEPYSDIFYWQLTTSRVVLKWSAVNTYLYIFCLYLPYNNNCVCSHIHFVHSIWYWTHGIEKLIRMCKLNVI